MIVRRFVVFTSRQLDCYLLEFVLQGEHISKRSHGLINDAATAMMLHNLRQIPYLHSSRHSHLTTCGTLQAAYQLKNGRLSSTILTDKADLITLADVEIDLIQQCEAAVCNCQIIN